jgi:hypothetical protein
LKSTQPLGAVQRALEPHERETYEAALNELRLRLDPDVLAALWEDGWMMNSETAAAYALDEETAPSIH